MQTSYETIRLEHVESAIARLTLNRPDRMNAYTTRLCEEMVDALETYLRDDSLRVLIVTGAGRGFCAGGDIAGDDPDHGTALESQLGHAREMRDGMHRVMQALARVDKPVIAMVNGPAVAGGLALALACDIRMVSDRAKMGDTSGRVGLLPDEGGAWLFPRFMGLDRALRMSLLSEVYDATEAKALGLATEVIAHDALEAETLALARRLAGAAPLAARLTKRMMQRAADTSFEHSLGDAQLSVMIANASEDVREGVRAFFDKRDPEFKGR
ncbi:enoyl-CoA hydratase/isomerase family protein [Ectothiorhodospiraceae bacterium WFHF3C12]|nr:enoyl-CoA hydratase/isomerase family protein [Ectothiorhodospiraceae bacterium WFHF3C12]